jgi:hypothetical protein
MKYFELRKLKKYMEHLKNPKVPFHDGYLEIHKTEIDCLDWLIASYEGRAGKPIDYLESLMKIYNARYDDYVFEMEKHNIIPLTEVERLKMWMREINFLYHWIYYKQIVGF